MSATPSRTNRDRPPPIGTLTRASSDLAIVLVTQRHEQVQRQVRDERERVRRITNAARGVTSGKIMLRR